MAVIEVDLIALTQQLVVAAAGASKEHATNVSGALFAGRRSSLDVAQQNRQRSTKRAATQQIAHQRHELGRLFSSPQLDERFDRRTTSKGARIKLCFASALRQAKTQLQTRSEFVLVSSSFRVFGVLAVRWRGWRARVARFDLPRRLLQRTIEVRLPTVRSEISNKTRDRSNLDGL